MKNTYISRFCTQNYRVAFIVETIDNLYDIVTHNNSTTIHNKSYYQTCQIVRTEKAKVKKTIRYYLAFALRYKASDEVRVSIELDDLIDYNSLLIYKTPKLSFCIEYAKTQVKNG